MMQIVLRSMHCFCITRLAARVLSTGVNNAIVLKADHGQIQVTTCLLNFFLPLKAGY